MAAHGARPFHRRANRYRQIGLGRRAYATRLEGRPYFFKCDGVEQRMTKIRGEGICPASWGETQRMARVWRFNARVVERAAIAVHGLL
jgi:hypothetical protein